MWYTTFLVFLLTLSLGLGSTTKRRKSDTQYLRNLYPTWDPLPAADGVGDRLILTPYIESGNIEEARNLSAVSDEAFFTDIPSYSGFFTVNKEYNSNLYFWFFPAEQNYETAPLLLWLQGGPGASSLYGLFTEVGPFFVLDDISLARNPYSWHKNYSIIFIDNPVGTGFSFTDYVEGYASEQVQIASELYSAMTQFFTVFSELQKVPFFIIGESYAGKYVPSLGYTIHQNNPTAELKINLQGIAVGNGFTDPISMLDYSDFVYQLGLVDTNGYNKMKALEEEAVKAIQEGRFIDAYSNWSEDLDLFYAYSQLYDIYNFLYEAKPVIGGNYEVFLQRENIRKALHVGSTSYANGNAVYAKLVPEFMNTTRPYLEEVMNNYKVLFYNGQMDIIVAYPLSVRMFNTLQYDSTNEYLEAKRVPWYVNGHLAGYMKTAGNFTEVMVRNAGHMVPADQPIWAIDLINRFTNNNLLKN